ncbi:unnamed protein product [Phytomonas sp. Hart1]|nr:unnamed protein product [Phytomonas sp. Hart1]|eukprot:CCW71810.1 unnamed protein product [Phytomonas sp. isolate Hart1]
MLKRQPLWIPVLTHNPGFARAFRDFRAMSAVSNRLLDGSRVSAEDIHVALDVDPKIPHKKVAVLMAFPLRVHGDLCDAVGPKGEHGLLCGVETALADCMNTVHVIERLLPASTPNVSVSIHAESLRRINKGDRILVVSAIDKMGKSMVYLKTDFYLEPESASEEMVMRERDIASLQDLRMALNLYEKLAHVVHVKCILNSKK